MLLTKAQEALIKNIEKEENILSLNIRTASEKWKVSPSLVTKTLKRVGYNGWKDFVAMAFVRSISKAKNFSLDKTKAETVLALENISDINSNFVFNKLMNEFKEKRKIIFIGEGFSKAIADDQMLRYAMLNMECKSYSTPNYLIGSTNPDTVVVYISISGTNRIIHKSAEYLSNKGVSTFLITSNPKIENDCYKGILRAPMHESNNLNIPTSTRISIILMLDILFEKVTLSMNSKKEMVKTIHDEESYINFISKSYDE